MRPELSLVAALAAALLFTPLAIRLARATSFYDRPAGYKGHGRPTPYLGGSVVIAAFLLAAALFGGADSSAFAPIAIGAVALLVVGTVDDRYGLGPLTRMAIEVGVAAVLYAGGVGWTFFASDALDFAFTVVFVVGVVNAYNLMDNMDGATATVAGVSAAVLGILAAQRSTALAAFAFALSGACLGFLRFNLASPARIFLGDGGSMPIGFVVAALIMAMPGTGHLGWAFVPVAVVLVGLPALDTTLVVVSRLRRGTGVFTGGRDHLTHRLRLKLGSARRVALVLAASQALFVTAGAFLVGWDESFAASAATLLIVLGAAVVAWFESPDWAPEPAGEWST